MTELESLQNIKDTAVRLQETHLGSGSITMVEKALQQLVDRFSRENQDIMVPERYEAAKDFEYFMMLVDLAMAYYRDGSEGGKGSVESKI
jgi:hypothetical protein